MAHKIGVGTSSIDWAELERRVGAPLEARRSYRQGGNTPSTMTTIEKADVAAGRMIVTSWQPLSVSERESLVDGGSDNMIRGWLQAYPTDANVIAIMGHEPTNTSKVHIWPNSSTYLTACDRFADILAEVNQERERRIRFWGCHIPWHAKTGQVNGWFHERWRGVAWDGYDWFGTTPEPGAIYDVAFNMTKALDKRVAIGEFGSDLWNDDTNKPNTDRPAWIKSVRDYCDEWKAAFVLYWDNSNWLLKTDAEFQALAPR